MASTSFRDSMNSLGWSRRDQDVPVNTAQQSGLMSSIKSLNPFQNNSYIQLPTTEGAGAPLPAANRREEEEGFATLSRWDRLLIFGACNLGALACFVLCFAFLPVLSVKPRKFLPARQIDANQAGSGNEVQYRKALLLCTYPPSMPDDLAWPASHEHLIR
ncbi:GOLGI traffic protein [Colletotrichum tofieldiae]|nr:GOLGI traffic protein [Colletotrichum tofieldiae]